MSSTIPGPAALRMHSRPGKGRIGLSGTYIPLRTVLGLRRLRDSSSRPSIFALECVSGIVAVSFIGALVHWFPWLLAVAALLCLLVVVPIALLCGFWQAAIVSLCGVVVQSFVGLRHAPFNPVRDPANSVTLLAFVLTALLISRLSARITEHARESDSWGGQTRDLYEFTRRTLQMNLHVEPGPQLAELVHEIFALEGVVVFDADLHQTCQAGYWSDDPQELAQNVYYFETSDDDPETGIGRRVVRLGAVPIGSLVIRGDTSPLTNNAIASLIATTFDRYRAFANESRIETERQTEQLRATVLDSLAHAYKTPLTAIRAASTGLSEMGRLSPAQSELVSLIDEQANQLSDLTARLLTTARLDAGEVSVNAVSIGVAPLIEEVLTSLGDRTASMKVALHIPDENIELCCDRQLMVTLLTQYIDNACKYSNYGSTITIGVEQTNAEVIFSVHSYGPVIPIADRERIFDRYYRASNSSNRAAGTGIGLAVAKRVAVIHGGYVWVTSDEQEGTTFFAAIPAPVQKRKAP
ncbi:MAG TPA: ATP-binding protein [Terracidiphilus sp.]|jgi:two-component system sensor histidine kinase KdpD|nr:ATP-binding protein [Terracidiphilus sp.]